MTPNLDRYERIAAFYDLLDLPFERRRYRALRPLLFQFLRIAGSASGARAVRVAAGRQAGRVDTCGRMAACVG
jgi:hypothetical protein